MVPRPSDLLKGIEGAGKAQRLECLKKVKNSVIGNKHRKELFIKAGAIGQIIELLSATESDPEVVVQSSALLGSLVFNTDEGAAQALQLSGLEVVLSRLVQSQDLRVVEAAVRCAKMLCQATTHVPPDAILAPLVLSHLTQLLHPSELITARLADNNLSCAALVEGVAQILTCACNTTSEQQVLTEAGVLQAVLTQLPRMQLPSGTSLLQLLSNLLRSNAPNALHVLKSDPPTTLDMLLYYLRQGQPLTQAWAASCISHLAAALPQPPAPAPAASSSRRSPPASPRQQQPQQQQQPQSHLAILASLVSDPPALILGTGPRSGGAAGGSGSAANGGGFGSASTGAGLRSGGLPSAAARVTALLQSFPGPILRGSPSQFTAGQGQGAAANSPGGGSGGSGGVFLTAPLFRQHSNRDAVVRRSASRTDARGEPGGCAGGSAVVASIPVMRSRDTAVLTAEGGAGASRDVAMSSGDSPRACDVDEATIDSVFSAQRSAFAVVLRCLDDPEAGGVAAVTLATMLEDSEELLQAASTSGVARQLCHLVCPHYAVPPALRSASDAPLASGRGSSGQRNTQGTAVLESDRTQEGWLRSLGALCMAHEDSRRYLFNSNLMDTVIAALRHPAPGMSAAAAMCVLAYTRHIKPSRPSVVGPIGLTEALCGVLQHQDVTVQVNACAALCNLVLEVSGTKDTLVKTGALDTLTTLTSSHHQMVRLYSSWALRNLFYKSSGAVKRALMQALGWPRMRALLSDPHEGVQEQAVCMLRNLCMDAADHITSAMDWGGADLLAALEEKLDPSRSVPSVLRVHALYTLVNSLTGSESTKEFIMSSNIPALICHHLRSSTQQEVRLPAVWCIINLSWVAPASTGAGDGPTGTDSPSILRIMLGGAAAGSNTAASSQPTTPSSGVVPNSQLVEGRLRRLRTLGCQECLMPLLDDTDPDVRQAARHAVDLLKAPSITPVSSPFV